MIKQIKLNTDIVISKELYDEYIEQDQWLAALDAAGVDNWEGFEYAKDIVSEWNNE